MLKFLEWLGLQFFEIFECFAKRLVLNQKWHSIIYFRLFKAPGMYHRFKPNVGKYTIHGAYGIEYVFCFTRKRRKEDTSPNTISSKNCPVSTFLPLNSGKWQQCASATRHFFGGLLNLRSEAG